MKLSGLVLAAFVAVASCRKPTFEYGSRSNKQARGEHQWKPRAPYHQPAQHPQLFPAVHPSVDKRDHVHLKRGNTASLYYTENGNIHLIDAQMVAILDTQFHWDTVILDHSDYIQSVACSPSSINIAFNSQPAFQSAKTNWTDTHVVFVSSDKTCHTVYPGQFGFFNASSVAFDTKALKVTAQGNQITMQDAVAEYNIVWGEYQASSGAPLANVQKAAASVTTSSSSSTTSKTSTTSSSKSTFTSTTSKLSSSTPSTTSKTTSTSSSTSSKSTSASSSTTSKASSAPTSTSKSTPISTSSSTSSVKSSATSSSLPSTTTKPSSTTPSTSSKAPSSSASSSVASSTKSSSTVGPSTSTKPSSTSSGTTVSSVTSKTTPASTISSASSSTSSIRTSTTSSVATSTSSTSNKPSSVPSSTTKAITSSPTLNSPSSSSTFSSVSSSITTSTISTTPASTSSLKATSSSVVSTTKSSSTSPSTTSIKPTSSSGATSSSVSSTSSVGLRVNALAASQSTTTQATTTSATPEGFHAMSKPSTTGKCAALPTPLPAAYKYLTGVRCDDTFDKTIDDFLDYLGDSSNFDAAIAAFAPGVDGISMSDYNKDTGALKKRMAQMEGKTLHSRGWLKSAFNWVNKNIIKPVAKAIVNVVKEVATTVYFVAKTLTQAAQDAVNFIRKEAEALLPNFSPSVSFNIPISCQAPDWMLDDSPWGDAFKMWEWKKGESEFNYGLNAGALAKMVGADELLTFKIDGVEQLPEPGIELYCVDCNIKGTMKTTGSATFTLLAGFTKLSMRFEGNINALVQLGLNAYAEYTKDLFHQRILEAGVPGFFIPGVIVVGPMLTLDVDAVMEIDALGQMLAGARLNFDHIGAYIDFFDTFKSSAHGFVPQVDAVFNVSGEITAKASVGIPIGIGIGIDILHGTYTKEVAIVDRPAVQALASYSGNKVYGGTKKRKIRDELEAREDKSDLQLACKGIYYNAGLINDITLNILDSWKYSIGNWEGHKFVEGCVGDNGVSIVKQQQQPNAPGKTRGGCTLSNDLIVNSGFDTLTGNAAAPWRYSISPNIYGFNDPRSIAANIYIDSKASSAPRDIGFWIANADNTVSYSASLFQTVTACTYSPYDISFTARLLHSDGTCKIVSAFAKSDSNPALNVVVPVNQVIYPVTDGKDFMAAYGPYTVSFLGPNNANSISINFGLTIQCDYASQFDLRVDDISVVPNPAAYSKRDLSGAIAARDDANATDPALIPDLSESAPVMVIDVNQVVPSNGTQTSAQASSVTPDVAKRGNALPAMSQGNALPTIAPANNAPAIPTKPATAMPGLPAANSLPAIDPNYQAPSLTYKPVTYTGSQPAGVDPTQMAVQIGPADYDFPPFSEMMKSATLGVIGSAPTDSATSGEPFTGWGQLPDLTGKAQIAAAEDGNIYLSGYPGSGAGTTWYSEDSVVVTDYAERVFHYYPDTMNLYGVSRLRLATVDESPMTSQLITLVPFYTPSGTVYGAVDTQGNAFLLAWCSAPHWIGSKVFLTKDYDNSLKELLAGEVQWIVTGNNVTECNPLLLTSGAAPLVGPVS